MIKTVQIDSKPRRIATPNNWVGETQFVNLTPNPVMIKVPLELVSEGSHNTFIVTPNGHVAELEVNGIINLPAPLPHRNKLYIVVPYVKRLLGDTRKDVFCVGMKSPEGFEFGMPEH